MKVTAKIQRSSDYPATIKQIRFAVTLALTKTGGVARDAVQGGLTEFFHIRREDRIKKGIKLSPATLADPVALVSSLDNYLSQHEFGGEKSATPSRRRKPAVERAVKYPDWLETLVGSESHVSIPDDFLTQGGQSVVPNSQRPRRFLKKSTVFPTLVDSRAGNQLLVIMQRKRRKRRKETARNRAERLGMKRSSQRLSVRRKARRSATARGGSDPARSRFVLRRNRPAGFRSPPRKEDRDVKVLYVLARSAKIDQRKFFQPIVEKAARASFADEFRKAFAIAIQPKPRKGRTS